MEILFLSKKKHDVKKKKKKKSHTPCGNKKICKQILHDKIYIIKTEKQKLTKVLFLSKPV